MPPVGDGVAAGLLEGEPSTLTDAFYNTMMLVFATERGSIQMRRANNAKSKIRSRVERVFAEQKDRDGAIHQDYRDRPSSD